jgi:hypothetical protein
MRDGHPAKTGLTGAATLRFLSLTVGTHQLQGNNAKALPKLQVEVSDLARTQFGSLENARVLTFYTFIQFTVYKRLLRKALS